MGYFFLPPREESGPRPPFDWLGAVSLFVAIFALLAALSNGQRWGWSSDGVLGLIAFSLVVGAGFIAWEKRAARPLLDLAIFRNRGFLMGAIAIFLFGGAFYAIMYLLPQFVQSILHYDPITAGILFTPSTLVLGILVPLVGKLSDRWPPHYLTLPGLAFALFAVYRMAHIDWNTSFASLALSMALLSVGMASFPPPTLSKAIASLPPKLIGYGSGAINFALQLGGAFGTAALVTLMDQRTLFHSDHLTAGLTPGNSVAIACRATAAGGPGPGGHQPPVPACRSPGPSGPHGCGLGADLRLPGWLLGGGRRPGADRDSVLPAQPLGRLVRRHRQRAAARTRLIAFCPTVREWKYNHG